MGVYYNTTYKQQILFCSKEETGMFHNAGWLPTYTVWASWKISKLFAIGNTGVLNTVFNNLSDKLKFICGTGRYMPPHVSLIFDFTGTIEKNCCANFFKFLILQMLQSRENTFVKLFFGNSFLMKINSPEDDCAKFVPNSFWKFSVGLC